MKKASIISVGNELLTGATVDSNAVYLSRSLLSLAVPPISGYTAADDVKAIGRALKSATEDADIVIVTGGLGPTDDDVTRQAISEFCGCELVLDEELLSRIKQFFVSRGRQMSEVNKKQALLPEGAKPLQNKLGTAPGIKLQYQQKLIYIIPGVPAEAESMFEEFIRPDLEKLEGRSAISVRYLRCFGKSESDIAQMLGETMHRGRNPLVNITARDGVKTLHIIAKADNSQKADEIAEQEHKHIAEMLGEVVFTTEQESLAEVVATRLFSLHKTISVAESCTGGLTGKLLTDVPGSSDYFKCGWVTYSNESKMQQLKVPAEIIESYGAVSEQVARALAANARRISNTDYAISVTGIAGPGGATTDKPVGFFYICIASDRNEYVKSFNFSGNRESIRNIAANTALNMLRLRLLI